MTVTSLGLQCYTLRKQALHSSKQSKALQEAANANLTGILWAKYQHHSRLLVLATEFDLVVMQITGQVCSSSSRLPVLATVSDNHFLRTIRTRPRLQQGNAVTS